MIIATDFNHQFPALEHSQRCPGVVFEPAGGWWMGADFADFIGSPPEAWQTMGVAAGLMTEMAKLGQFTAFPLGSTVIDSTREPIVQRYGFAKGCMAPFTRTVLQDVREKVSQTKAGMEAGESSVFVGPSVDQDGATRLAEREALTADKTGSGDWSVEGVLGSLKSTTAWSMRSAAGTQGMR